MAQFVRVEQTMVEFKKMLEMINNYGDEMNASYWGNALAGEVGEACNLIKKFDRDKKDVKDELAFELADILNYLILTAKFFNIDLEKAFFDKYKYLESRKNERNYEIFPKK